MQGEASQNMEPAKNLILGFGRPIVSDHCSICARRPAQALFSEMRAEGARRCVGPAATQSGASLVIASMMAALSPSRLRVAERLQSSPRSCGRLSETDRFPCSLQI